MSWLFKSLQFTDDEQQQQQEDDAVSVSPTAGVKEDLSAIGETIGRQLRGVASFLAPPPGDSAGDSSLSSSSSSSKAISGIRSDLAEFGGSFKTSLSLFSSVTEISKLASNLLQLKEDETENNDNNGDDDDDEEDEEVDVGITDEVIEFANAVSKRPELWTEFPLSLDDDHEFDMSDVQSEHASVVRQLVPSLTDLRNRLSNDISDKQFWMIYFILLLPRLNEDDFELLSTPEIIEAREMLLQLLQTKDEGKTDSENPQSDNPSASKDKINDAQMAESQKSPEKSIIPDNPSRTESKESENTVKLLEGGEEETVTTGTSAAAAPKQFQSEDDVSFSDLEDDDNDLSNRQSRSVPAQSSTRGSSPEGSMSNEWVRLNKNGGTGESQLRGQSSSRDRDSEGDESNDWLTVDDYEP